MRIQTSFLAPELQARYIAYLEEITRFQINLGESLYDDFVTENRESFERWKRLYSNGGGGKGSTESNNGTNSSGKDGTANGQNNGYTDSDEPWTYELGEGEDPHHLGGERWEKTLKKVVKDLIQRSKDTQSEWSAVFFFDEIANTVIIKNVHTDYDKRRVGLDFSNSDGLERLGGIHTHLEGGLDFSGLDLIGLFSGFWLSKGDPFLIVISCYSPEGSSIMIMNDRNALKDYILPNYEYLKHTQDEFFNQKDPAPGTNIRNLFDNKKKGR